MLNEVRNNYLKFGLLSLPLIFTINSYAGGNHPESSTCPRDKPYYAVCTSSLHGLLGWTGQCYTADTEAENEAASHANKEHKGDTHWTGVSRTR